jgi:hypothetical protein
MNLEFERNVKEYNTLVGIKVQDEGKTDTTFSSDGQQSMPMPDSGICCKTLYAFCFLNLNSNCLDM